MWNREGLAEPLAAVRHQQGRLLGRMEALGFPLQQEAVLQSSDVLKTSEIEGEMLDAEQVRSLVASSPSDRTVRHAAIFRIWSLRAS